MPPHFCPLLSSPWFLSTTLFFLPPTLVSPYPCKLRPRGAGLIPAPHPPFQRFPRRRHSQPILPFPLRASNNDWLGSVTSWVFSHNRNLQGNPVKPRSASVTETIHFINFHYVPIISNKILSKIPLIRHVAAYQCKKIFFSSLWFQELNFLIGVIAQLQGDTI